MSPCLIQKAILGKKAGKTMQWLLAIYLTCSNIAFLVIMSDQAQPVMPVTPLWLLGFFVTSSWLLPSWLLLGFVVSGFVLLGFVILASLFWLCYSWLLLASFLKNIFIPKIVSYRRLLNMLSKPTTSTSGGIFLIGAHLQGGQAWQRFRVCKEDCAGAVICMGDWKSIDWFP